MEIMRLLNQSLKKDIMSIKFLLASLHWIALLCSGLISGVLATEVSNNTGGVIEYCEGQTFSARCKMDEAIIMRSAVYGRMRLGLCISIHSDLGCERDILPQFDSWCSGRRQCEVRVSSIYDTLRDNELPCTKNFRYYLEASYHCVKVIHRTKNCTGDVSRVEVAEMRYGHLASVVTEETSCGSNVAPWRLEAHPGQTIQLTLLDFNTADREKTAFSQAVCQVYAVIREPTILSHDTICRSDARESLAYTSLTNRVEVRIVTSHKSSDRSTSPAFLFRYQVLGCSDTPPPGVQWIRRLGAEAHAGCNSTGQHWLLKCEAGVWVGDRPNCTLLGLPVWSADSLSDDKNSFWIVFTGPQWAAIAVVLAIAVTLGLIIFLIGLIYIRRKRSRLQRAQSRGGAGLHCSLSDYHMSQCAQMGVGAYQATPYIQGSKHLHSSDGLDYTPTTGGENDYFRTWQLQRHAVGLGDPFQERGPFYHRPQYRSGPPIDSPTSPCRGVGSCRPGAEHIYESPKFERRDTLGRRGELGNSSGGQVAPTTPGAYTRQSVNPLQYYELKSRDTCSGQIV